MGGRIVMCIIMILQVGQCLKCFQCDNYINPACGVDFKAYQYSAETCPSNRYKCGLQRQKPKANNYIGIIRACYLLGSLSMLEDESDGCYPLMYGQHNETYTFCLCSKDYCNSSVTVSYSIPLTCGMLVIVISVLQRFRY